MSLIVNKKDSAYTDFLLATALHKFAGGIEKQYVLSADAPTFPVDIFTIEGIMSIRLSKGNVVHLNLISLDPVKYAAIVANVLKKG